MLRLMRLHKFPLLVTVLELWGLPLWKRTLLLRWMHAFRGMKLPYGFLGLGHSL